MHAAEGRPAAAYEQVVDWAAGQQDVANAQVVAMNEAGTGAQVLVTPASGPDAQATMDLLARCARAVVHRAADRDDGRRHRRSPRSRPTSPTG